MAVQFDRAIKLAEMAAGRFDARRGFEWKIVLGFWAAMLAAFSTSYNAPAVNLRWLLGGVILFALTWLRGVWAANQNDKRRYEYFLTKAEQCANVERTETSYPEKVTFCQSWKFILDWNAQFQILVTAALAALFYFGRTAGEVPM